MDADGLSFDQLEVGREWVSQARLVKADDIHDFADLTGDRSPIHVDAADAATTPFRPCVGHGILGMALGSGLAGAAPPVRTLAFLGIRDWRFLAPVFVGDEIHVRNRVQEKTARGVGRRGEVVWRVQVVNQKGQVVQDGLTVTLVAGDRTARRARQSGAGEAAPA